VLNDTFAFGGSEHCGWPLGVYPSGRPTGHRWRYAISRPSKRGPVRDWGPQWVLRADFLPELDGAWPAKLATLFHGGTGR